MQSRARLCLRAAALAVLGGAASGLNLRAQVVRGVARDRTTSIPLPGVLVTLDRADQVGVATSALERSTLTNARGEFALRAPAPGQYRVSAKRIGVQRYDSDPFALSAGETRVLDLTLAATIHRLDEVIVVREALCALHPAEAPRVAAMWDEINSALSATTISVRDSLVRARVTRYARLLEPRNLRVLGEAREEVGGLVDRPFRSPGAESLATHGYWRRMPADTLAFYGPDTDVLASGAFRRDHCFSIAAQRRDRSGLVGLAFEPARGRTVPDIRGTLWLDQQSLELRFVEFRYTHLPRVPHVDRIGGEVHFARLPNGAWIVRRWFIRMPRLAYASMAEGRRRLWSAQGFQLPRIDQLLEEGGDVSGERVASATIAATVRGRVVDSAGAPLRGLSVRLVGTAHRVTADSAGAFALHGVGAGRYELVAESAGYSSLGVPAAAAEVTIDSATSFGVTLGGTLRAFDTRALLARMCAGREPARDRIALRVIVSDSTTGRPLSGTTLRMRWAEYERGTAGGVSVGRVRPATLNGTTDGDGALVFCGVPAGTTLEVGFPSGDTDLRPIGSLRLEPGRPQVVELRSRS